MAEEVVVVVESAQVIADMHIVHGWWVESEHAVSKSSTGERKLVELLEGVYLAVQQRVLCLGVGAGDHERKIGLAQYRRAEDLVARGDSTCGQRQNVAVDDVEQARAMDVAVMAHHNVHPPLR